MKIHYTKEFLQEQHGNYWSHLQEMQKDIQAEVAEHDTELCEKVINEPTLTKLDELVFIIHQMRPLVKQLDSIKKILSTGRTCEVVELDTDKLYTISKPTVYLPTQYMIEYSHIDGTVTIEDVMETGLILTTEYGNVFLPICEVGSLEEINF